jgi:hypothetical protein
MAIEGVIGLENNDEPLDDEEPIDLEHKDELPDDEEPNDEPAAGPCCSKMVR